MQNPLFESLHSDDPALLAAAVARAPRPGHYDELRGGAGPGLTPPWRRFFGVLGAEGLSGLDERVEAVTRQVRENGITYNVYADANGPARPWSLDLLPLILEAEDWARIEAGIVQRTTLLNALLADLYGPQQMLHAGLLPPALTLGHPGYLRPLHGYAPPGGVHLHLAAFDLARGPDGRWWVVSQRTQAPSGLGYLLENRLAISRQFPEAFRELRVQHLASSYRALLDSLFALSPGSRDSRVVLLTPGPYNETYFEHAYLARYLGLTLVEGSDLTVRGDQVYMKTLHGLERVHVILRRLDDDYCDPLELRADSTLGVPGLLGAMRAGQVLIANSLGSAFLESPAVHGFLPAICERLLDAPLALPSLATWWCGEEAAAAQALDRLDGLVVKPTSGRRNFEPWLGPGRDAAAIAAMRAKIAADPDAYTAQSYLPLAQTPTWRRGELRPRPGMLRVFAVACPGGGYRILPGGLTRIAMSDEPIVSMQRGGTSADTWVIAAGEVDAFSLLPERLKPEDLANKRRTVSSRAAENLFWLGRYAERAENTVRIARLVLATLNGDVDLSTRIREAIGRIAAQNNLVPATSPAASKVASRAFERNLIAGLVDAEHAASVAFTLHALERTAGQIRDRLAPEHWSLVLGAIAELRTLRPGRRDGQDGTAADALPMLDRLSTLLVAITGMQADRMTRDDGWRLLTVGRQLERLITLARALGTLFESGAVQLDTGFGLALHAFDSTITYRALYQNHREIIALIDLLVVDTENPRSLACTVGTLRALLPKLPPVAGAEDCVALLPGPRRFDLAALNVRAGDGRYGALEALLGEIGGAAFLISDAIEQRYFSHALDIQAMRT
ncbi:MAG: circularly permuted type 2 ATP-grasp protein [Gammaproteobacteria bacterium]|nr:circularly permuted type 2 ATP-grasp protein [Gammaproteobacteria bacterium]